VDDRVREIIMKPGDTVGDALRRMDESGGRMVLVTDDNDALRGVATDGDMRRWIIAGRGLDDPLSGAMNPRPHVLEQGFRRESAELLMTEGHFECLPVLDRDGRVVDAVWWHDLIEGRPGIRRRPLGLPVVIMAGGRGTRLAPYTNVLPKPLVPIGDTPISQLIMERFAEWGCHDFLLMLNHKANLVRAYFAELDVPYRVECVVESQPLGTAGALALLAGRVDQTFFLTNCDVLVEADYESVLRAHRESGNEITLVASMKQFTVPYGVCQVGEGGRLTGITEKPSFDHLVSTGLYVVEPQVLDDVPRGAACDMNDLIDRCLEQGRRLGVYPVSEGAWLDMGALDPLRDVLGRLGADERG
jgi:dTDP-glucose pyrophosphorylase